MILWSVGESIAITSERQNGVVSPVGPNFIISTEIRLTFTILSASVFVYALETIISEANVGLLPVAMNSTT
jgi:hypothetical protein